MIIESYGLAGAGKSTFIEKLCKETNGINISKYINRGQKMLCLQAMFTRVLLITPKYNSIDKQFEKIMGKYRGEKMFYSDKTVDSLKTKYIFYLFLYNSTNKIKISVYMDEGFSQQLANFAVEYSISNSELKAIYDVFYSNLKSTNKPIWYYTDVNNAFDSIRRRKRSYKWIDDLPKTELIPLLEKFNEIHNNIYNLHQDKIKIIRTEKYN